MKRLAALFFAALFALQSVAGPFSISGSGQVVAQRAVTSGTTDTATNGDRVVLWNSSNAAVKTQTIQDCAAATNNQSIIIGDEAQTAGTYPITIAPASSGTINSLSSIQIATNGGFASLVCDGSQSNWVVTYLSTSSNVSAPQGRLTLVTGTAVMTTSQTNQGTLFYTAYHGGGKVPYYNGAFDALDTIPSNEVSTVMAASSTGVLNAAGVFDVWYSPVNHNICVATNGSGGGWASDTGGSNTARGSGYSALDRITRPYVTNASTLTHCYNAATDYGPIAANRATYLGTIKTDGTNAGKVNWTFGSSASGGGAAEFGICNAYNRVEVSTMVQDAATTWTYSTAAWRAFDATATGSGLNNRVTYVSCDGEYPITATMGTVIKTGANNADAAIGLGVDSATTPSGIVALGALSNGSWALASYSGVPGPGIHYVQALEWGNASATSFYGNTTLGGAPVVQGLSFRVTQ